MKTEADKASNRKYMVKYYLKNREKLLEYQRKYRHKNTKAVKEYSKKYWRLRLYHTPEERAKRQARNAINRKIIIGEIDRQNCEISGCEKIGEAHHEDYAKPLEVKWLCKTHHALTHRKIEVLL